MDRIYTERITSSGTTALFAVLAAIFLAGSGFRAAAVGFRLFPQILLGIGLFFVFYVVNYRMLEIRISLHDIHLQFGLVSWTTPLANIRNVGLDDSPPLIKYGGAGVHFAWVRGQYRAFFNFLEYPRVKINFKRKQGPVNALVFTTRNPEEVMEILRSRITQP